MDATPILRALIPLSLGSLTLAQPVLAPVTDGLFFQPKDGTALERTMVWTASMETSEVEMLENGEPSQNAPAVRSKVESSLSVTTIDEHVRSATNQPLELVRTFDDITLEVEGVLSLEGMGGAVSVSGEGESELDQIGVRFEYDADDEAWTTSFAEDYEGREELLEPLRVDGQFLALLPEDAAEVKVGDRWEVDVDVFHELLTPGGDLSIQLESDLDALQGVLDPLLLPGPFDLLEGDRSGEVVAKLKSVEDGVAVVEVAFEVEVASDQTVLIDELMASAIPEGGVADIEQCSYRLSLDGKAVLEWDQEAYHARSYELSAEARLAVEIGVSVDFGGEGGLFEMTETREGEVSFSMVLGD